jgi:hypothetical protein
MHQHPLANIKRILFVGFYGKAIKDINQLFLSDFNISVILGI